MSDAAFRPMTTEAPQGPQDALQPHDPNERDASRGDVIEEPLEGAEAVQDAILAALGVDDPIGIPEEDAGHLEDAAEYILQLVKQRGATPTQSSIRRALDQIKTDFELDPEAEPSAVLGRLGAIVTAWRGLGFVRDGSERRRILMKLSRLPDAASIDRALFEEMERRKVWQ